MFSSATLMRSLSSLLLCVLVLHCVCTARAANASSASADSSSLSPAPSCALPGCLSCLPGNSKGCAECAPGLDLMEDHCYHVARCAILNCSMCDQLDITRCSVCMEGFRITENSTCTDVGDAAGRAYSSMAALLVSVLVLGMCASLAAV